MLWIRQKLFLPRIEFGDGGFRVEAVAAALRDLCASDASKRLAASRVLERTARMVSNSHRKQAFGNRSATAALIEAFGDDDPKVVQNAVIAFAEVSRRYFKDDNAYPALFRQFVSPDALTRLWAINAAVTLRGAACLPDVLPMARDRSAKVRAEVIRLGVELAVHSELPATARSELRALAQATAADSDRRVREFAASLVGALGSPQGSRRAETD